MIEKDVWVDIQENTRKYISNDRYYIIAGVKKLRVSNSNTHYLECSDGSKFIIRPFWDVIQIEGDWIS